MDLSHTTQKSIALPDGGKWAIGWYGPTIPKRPRRFGPKPASGCARLAVSSVTRVPLCAVDFCPFPSEPDFHQCFCGSRLVEHHHVISRGMGGSKKRRNDPANVVCICHAHHEAVTLHRATI